MPLCPICGKTLVCDAHAPDHELGTPIQQCPLKKPGSIWVHLKDDSGTGVGGIKITSGGKIQTTDKSGFAAFDALPAGPYTAELGALTDAHEPPSEISKPAEVKDGGVKVLSFQVRRRAKLKVKVVQKGAPTKFLGDADVTVTGDENPPPGKTKSADGIADFGSRKAGNYTIVATLSPTDAPNFKAPTDPIPVTLAPGDDKTVPVEVTKLVYVTVRLKFKDDKKDVPNAKFNLMKGDAVADPGPLANGLIEVKNLEDGSYDISFPEIDAAEWEPA
jgi:hypothetical protein